MTTTKGVLLVDLENMVGQKAKPGIVVARMQALIQHAGPGVKVVAACARSRITPAGTKVLHEHDVALLTVDGSKDAADQALLAEAQRLANAGYHRFVVASNDSSFARLADLGDLEIVIWAGQKPRKNYTARASRINRLPIPATASAHTTAAKTPAETPPKPGTPAKTHQPVTPKNNATTSAKTTKPTTISKQRHPHPQPSPEQPDLATRVEPITAAIRLLTAGMIFGAGTALGDLAVRRLLRQRRRGG